MSTSRPASPTPETFKPTNLTQPIDNSTDSDSEESANIRKKNASAASKNSDEMINAPKAAASVEDIAASASSEEAEAPAPAPSPASSTPPTYSNIRASVNVPIDSSDAEGEADVITAVVTASIFHDDSNEPTTPPAPVSPVVRKEKSGSNSTSQGSEEEKEKEEEAEETADDSAIPQSPFDAVDETLIKHEFKGLDFADKPFIHQPFFFADVLLLVKNNLNNPKVAIDEIIKKVQKAQSSHLENISSPWNYFYNIIGELKNLKAETLVEQYNNYLEKTARVENLLHAIIQHSVAHNDNHFSKLHLYLLAESLSGKKDSKQKRKFYDFVELLTIELPEENPTVVTTADSSAPNADDNHEVTIAELERQSAPVTEFSRKISDLTKPYNTGFLGRFTGYSGEFKNLMQALHFAKPQTMLEERKAYETILQAEANISDFAKSIQTTVAELKALKLKKASPSSLAAQN